MKLFPNPAGYDAAETLVKSGQVDHMDIILIIAILQQVGYAVPDSLFRDIFSLCIETDQLGSQLGTADFILAEKKVQGILGRREPA